MRWHARQRNLEWQSWFAWFPVQYKDERGGGRKSWVWMETIERKPDWDEWAYRLKEVTNGPKRVS